MASAQAPGGPPAPLDAEGVWCESRRAPFATPRPALFVDRDGTLIELVPYLSEPARVKPVPGAERLVARANALEIPVVVVTNQSGVGRGYYGWREFAAVEQAIDRKFEAHGGRIDAVYACPHPPGALAPEPAEDPPCRKPNPGMLLRAQRDLNLDLASSWIVGDAASDLEAGKRAGLARGWLVPTGYGARDAKAAEGLSCSTFDTVVGRAIGSLERELEVLAAGGRGGRGTK